MIYHTNQAAKLGCELAYRLHWQLPQVTNPRNINSIRCFQDTRNTCTVHAEITHKGVKRVFNIQCMLNLNATAENVDYLL